MKVFFIITISLLVHLGVHGQAGSTSIKDSVGIISSFSKSINKTKLEEEGLILKNIQYCEHDGEEFLPPDSTLSIIDTDSSLIVRFIVYETSHLIIGWLTDIYTLKIMTS